MEKETSDLEECMKELAEAREKLKKAIAERDAGLAFAAHLRRCVRSWPVSASCELLE